MSFLSGVVAVAATQAAVVGFKDAAKIKSWDAWDDHKAPVAFKEKRCMTMEKLNALSIGYREIGRLRTRNAKEINDSKFSIGCETLDRDYADWNAYRALLGPLGVKHARFFSGWAKTEQKKGVYDFSWLDVPIRECVAMGVKPWICISYGNPVWGSDFRLGMRVKQVTDNSEAMSAWLRYVQALVTRYKDVVDEWEVWNEPFNQDEEYAELFYQTAKAVRAVQPSAKCYCTAVAYPLGYKAVLERLKKENALDLGSLFAYHPYSPNPDWSYHVDEGQMTYQPAMSIRELVKSYDQRFDILQGESGCPSQLEYAHALANREWTEYAQAKWLLRRTIGDAVRDIPCNVFTMIDLQYTFMLQSFGLVRSNTLKEFVYRRPGYFAMQNVFGLLDDAAKPVSLVTSERGLRRLSEARFARPEGTLAFFWFSDGVPSNDLVFKRLSVELNEQLVDPVWIEMITGRIFEIPAESVSRSDGKTLIRDVPLWDSPVLVIGRACLAGKLADLGTAPVSYVDEHELHTCSCGLGKRVLPRKSVANTPLSVAGKTYERGFGTHPESAVGFLADGKLVAFEALVGIDDSAEKAKNPKGYGQPAAVFRVWADGRIVWTSPEMKMGQSPVSVRVDLAGVREVVLETRGGSSWSAYEAAHGDWLEARFVKAPDARLVVMDDLENVEQLEILTPPERPEPQINGADIFGVRPGHPVLFRVATSGVRPMRFSADWLPEGIELDVEKGVLRGVAPSEKGDYDIVVTAENEKGKATRALRLSVGETIALTPPMGWNSWNMWCYRLTQEHVEASARALEDSGLGNHGWSYVNMDDWWTMNTSGCERVEMRQKDFGGREDVIGAPRDSRGRINPNRSFPDMKGLTDYIHSFGFKAGLYSGPGPLTCGKCEASYGHELQDATSWADWGFDYVKYDWCSYDSVFKKVTGLNCRDAKLMASRHYGYEKPYRLMGECLRRQDRDIVFSLCQYGMGKTEEWGESTGGNCWRTWDDLKDSWAWMEEALAGGVGAEKFHAYNKPGWWADPDMLIVGDQYSFGGDHPTYLTRNEQYTHMSLWCMLGAPLLIGCDLATLDDFTRNLLVNDEVIAVNQDRLGKTARQVRRNDAESVWVRPLSNGFTAVALVNRYPFSREIKVSFGELGMRSGEHFVRDLWRQKCEGKHSGHYFARVPPHATKLVKMRDADCVRCDR